jgi:glycosyltransferase involved in cell wall biosynthesis
MEPSFAIIMTTYKRPAEVLRAVGSIRAQSHTSWRAIVVIDDTETDYSELMREIGNDTRFTLLRNTENSGKNASVNRALAVLRHDNFRGHIVFLDDDDWLAPACLADFATAIRAYPENHWFVSQRTHHETNVPYTFTKTTRDVIHYASDCLIERRFGGDATHCIDFTLTTKAEFPTQVKNAEEWLYFATVATIIPNFRYRAVPGTYSAGYAPGGITDLYHENTEQKQNAPKLAREVWERKIFDPYILLYIGLRLIRSIFS